VLPPNYLQLGLVENLKEFDDCGVNVICLFTSGQFQNHGCNILNVASFLCVPQELLGSLGQVYCCIKLFVVVIGVLCEEVIQSLILLGGLLDSETHQFILTSGFLEALHHETLLFLVVLQSVLGRVHLVLLGLQNLV